MYMFNRMSEEDPSVEQVPTNTNNTTENNPTRVPIPILNLEVGKPYLFGRDGYVRGKATLVDKFFIPAQNRYILSFQTDQSYRDKQFGFITSTKMLEEMAKFKEKPDLQLGVSTKPKYEGSPIRPHYARQFGIMDVGDEWEFLEFYENASGGKRSGAYGKRSKRSKRRKTRRSKKMRGSRRRLNT